MACRGERDETPRHENHESFKVPLAIPVKGTTVIRLDAIIFIKNLLCKKTFTICKKNFTRW